MMRLTIVAAGTLLLAACSPAAPDYDLLVRNGTVFDGSLQPGRIRDIGIISERIVTLYAPATATAARVIDAEGQAGDAWFHRPAHACH